MEPKPWPRSVVITLVSIFVIILMGLIILPFYLFAGNPEDRKWEQRARDCTDLCQKLDADAVYFCPDKCRTQGFCVCLLPKLTRPLK